MKKFFRRLILVCILGAIAVNAVCLSLEKNGNINEINMLNPDSAVSDEDIKITDTIVKDAVNALPNKDTLTGDKAKELLTTSIEKNVKEAIDNEAKNGKEEITEITEEKAGLLAKELKKSLIREADELPTLTDADMDQIVTKVVEKINSTVSEENLEDFFEANSIKEFNEILEEKMTSEKLGGLSKFMRKWIDNMPDINSIAPSKNKK